MRRLTIFFATFSLFSAGCGSIKRPNTDICVVNEPGGYQICYNLYRDYNSNGQRKPDAKPFYKPAKTVSDLNKNICTDPQGFANLLIYISQLREALD